VIKKIFLVILILAISSVAYGADVARQVDFLAAGLEQDGNALSGGKVFTYEAGTTTAKQCWTDRTKSTPETNPIILSSEGRSTTFCDGIYKMVIKDSTDVTLVTMDGIAYGEQGVQTTNLSSYGSLAEAIADIGSTKTVLILDATDTLDANVGVPSNVTLVPLVREAITLNGKTLTVNGDIWAGSFEWIIGSGTFAGSPTVQFYDPTWTASTVTDSATPTYTTVSFGTIDIDTISNGTTIINGVLTGSPTISDFTNATHTHINNATGGDLFGTLGIQGSSSKLSIIRSNTQTVTLTADSVTLTNATGSVVFSDVNAAADITNSGAHGLDPDDAPESSNTWYYIWLIGNTAGDDALFLSETYDSVPTLPSGYDYSALVGAVRNNASSNFVNFYQKGNEVSVERSVAVTITATSVSGLTLISYVPVTAASIIGNLCIQPNTIGNSAYVSSLTNTIGETQVIGQVTSIATCGKYIATTFSNQSLGGYKTNASDTASMDVTGYTYYY
jgi:hypothetical protein